MEKIKAQNILFPLTAVMPVAISMGVCSDIGAAPFLFSALLFSILCNKTNKNVPFQIYLDFLIINQVYSIFGKTTAIIGMIIGSLLLSASYFFADKIRKFISSELLASLMLSTALTLTVLQTTNYFGIGAVGNTAVEMIKCYRSLGFHPNWRGILYGTIVMVIMITFPRKFKKASLIVKASFIALIFTTVLNILLIPSDMLSPIAEVGKVNPFIAVYNLNFDKPHIPYSVLCGFALFISNLTLFVDSPKSDRLSCGIINTVAPAFSLYAPCRVASKRELPRNILCSLTLIFCFALSIPFERAPVASLAVVLIVGAWQSVEWRRLAEAFSSPISAVVFVMSTVIILVTNLSLGVILAAVMSLVASIIFGKKAIKE